METMKLENPILEIDAKLKHLELRCGAIQEHIDEAELDGLDHADLKQQVDMLKKEAEALQRKKRALERRAAHATQDEKAAAKHRRDAIIQNVAMQIADLMAEGGGHVRTLKDYGARLTAALNAGQSLDDEVLRFQCNKIRLAFRVYLLHAIQQFPGCNLGLAPFMGLEDKHFEDLAPTVEKKKKT